MNKQLLVIVVLIMMFAGAIGASYVLPTAQAEDGSNACRPDPGQFFILLQCGDNGVRCTACTAHECFELSGCRRLGR